MTLKYSDDEVTDKELRELNLQTRAHQYMMEGIRLQILYLEEFFDTMWYPTCDDT